MEALPAAVVDLHPAWAAALRMAAVAWVVEVVWVEAAAPPTEAVVEMVAVAATAKSPSVRV